MLPKSEPQSRVKEEMNHKSEPATVETKEELSDQNVGDQTDDLCEELQRNIDAFPPHDSEDSFEPEHVADELRRLAAEFPPVAASAPQHACCGKEPQLRMRFGKMPNTHPGDQEGIMVEQRPLIHSCFTRPYGWNMASARAHEEPVEQLRDRMRTMKQNLETLRTRLTQVADLRDAQGLREGQRALHTRLAEVEECTSVQTLREFMTRILKMESLVCGEQGGVIGEAIRTCNRRLDNHKATMDDFYARIRIQDWYHDLSEQESEEELQQNVARIDGQDANAENQPGVENRLPVRRRTRNYAPQRRIQRQNPRPQQTPRPDDTAMTDEAIQQAMQHLFAAYTQCVARVTHTDDCLEQFRDAIRHDALELALTVQRTSQDLHQQEQSVEQIKRTLFDVVQVKVDHFEEKFRMFGDHLDGVTRTIERSEHSKCASISAMISEQEDSRRRVEELAKRLDHPQEGSSSAQSELNTAVQLELGDIKAKILRLTDQCTEHDGKLTFFETTSEQVNLTEQQIHKWRYRLPDLTDDHSKRCIVTAVEAQEDLDKFKDKTMEKVRQVNNALVALERKFSCLNETVMILGKLSVTE